MAIKDLILIRTGLKIVSNLIHLSIGANVHNYRFPLPVIFGIEVLASGPLMAVIFAEVYTKGLRGFSGIVIGEIVGKTLKS